jgi:CHAD domain-containing protein
VKARKVKGLDPQAPLADGAERIVGTRLDELAAFMPRAADPREVEALHDMRIAAKRLRYALELTAPGFGPYAIQAIRLTKELQDLLGEIHDCDVQLPDVRSFARGLLAEDARALVAAAGPGAEDLDPALVARAPHRADHAGLAALTAHLLGRRELLFGSFVEWWEEQERKGFRARLEYAITERS